MRITLRLILGTVLLASMASAGPTSAVAASRPSLVTDTPTRVTASGATLTGTVNPNGQWTNYRFNYGTTSGYGHNTPSTYAGSGSTSVSIQATLTGLTASTVYHYRLVASNATGTTWGPDHTFTTSTGSGSAPAAVTGAPSAMTGDGATVSGSVNPNGLATTYYFKYGASTAYGQTTPQVSAGSGTTATPVQATLASLSSNSTYHYQLVATNADGTSSGQDQTFTTSAGTSTTTPGGTTASGSGTASSGSAGPVGIPGTWSARFDDEFDGTGLDTSKWTAGWFGSGITKAPNGSEQNCEDPSDVRVTNGELDLTATATTETCGGTTQPYASGLISSNGKYQFTGGAFEARIWTPGTGSTIADWPAFWADGQNWPTDGEIDVLEGLNGKPCYHFHYTGGGPGGCATVTNAAAGWHTYAANWDTALGVITYYYDGQQVGQWSTGVTTAPMYLIAELGVSNTISPPITTPATMRIDYIRVWQH